MARQRPLENINPAPRVCPSDSPSYLAPFIQLGPNSDAPAPPADRVHHPSARAHQRAADGRDLPCHWGLDHHDLQHARQRGPAQLQPAHSDRPERRVHRGQRVPGGRVLLGRRAGVHPLSGGQVLDLCHSGELGDVCLLRGGQVLAGGGRELQFDLHRLSERDLLGDGWGQPGQRLPVLPGEFQFLFWVQAPAGVLVYARPLRTQRGCLLTVQQLGLVPLGPGLPLPAQLALKPHVVVARAVPVPPGLLRRRHDGRAGPHALPGTHAHF